MIVAPPCLTITSTLGSSVSMTSWPLLVGMRMTVKVPRLSTANSTAAATASGARRRQGRAHGLERDQALQLGILGQ
jgi:hypothetical protein